MYREVFTAFFLAKKQLPVAFGKDAMKVVRLNQNRKVVGRMGKQ